MSNKLERELKHWWVDEMATAPADDPRHSAECLNISDIEDIVAGKQPLTVVQQDHVRHCPWCTRLKALAACHEAPSFSDTLLLSYSPQLTEYLAAWLRDTQRSEQVELTATPAHFDSNGTLRVHWVGASPEGAVTLFLTWNGGEIDWRTAACGRGCWNWSSPCHS